MRVATEAEPVFEVVLAHLDGHVRVKLRGDLDYPATVLHREALREVTDLRTRVVLDLAELEYIDSAGLVFLVQLTHLHEGPVRLENVPALVTSLLNVTGLTEFFDVDGE